MGLNNISFVLGQGGLGRPLPGNDYISGLIFYCGNGALPSGFSTTNRIKKFFSPADALANGINNNYNDATAATGSYLFTAIGANGDSINISVKGLYGAIINLGTYTKASTETSVTLIAAAVAVIINSGTATNGFTAVASTGTVTITAPGKFGIFLNSGSPIVITLSSGATIAGTLTQFTGGVASLQSVWYYHISEFFRIQPQGVLYVGFFAVPGSYTYAEITTMQNFAVGAIRQIGIYKDGAALSAGDLTAIDIQCKALVVLHKEIIGLIGADISGTTDISTLPDLSQLTANTASAIIAQDGAAQGATLFLTYGKSITTLGASLGAVALAKVMEDIAWPAKFNISNGVECDTIAFANGKLFSDPTITDPLLTTLQNYRYIFLRKFIGYAGSYFNEDSAAVSVSSDYAYIADNRTIQKATRGVYVSMIPALNSVFTLNADGTLSDNTIAYFTGLAEVNLIQMARDGEISAQQVVINPTQNVLQTGLVTLTVNIVPVGTARNIQVNIGFNVSISGS